MSDRRHVHLGGTGKKRLHQDWRTWTVLILMLTAISIYVLTLDDAVVPIESAPPPASQP
jgi:hypothetical protein